MSTEIEKLTSVLECNEKLREHIKDYIEIFVEYYGEDQRAYIEEKFNRAIFVGYLSDINLSNTLHEIENEKSNMLYDEIVEGIDIDKRLLFEQNYSFRFMNVHPLFKYQTYYEEHEVFFRGCS